MSTSHKRDVAKAVNENVNYWCSFSKKKSLKHQDAPALLRLLYHNRCICTCVAVSSGLGVDELVCCVIGPL